MIDDFDRFIVKLGLDRLDDYSYECKLGSGGQATVCVYSDPNGKKVAAKLLICPRNADEQTRFHREADALQRVNRIDQARDGRGSFIRALSSVKQFSDLPIFYFFMELAGGTSLSAMLEKEPPPWDWRRALGTVRRISWALWAAHKVGFVHRDLHPGNIFLDDEKFRSPDDAEMGVTILDLGVHADIWEGFDEAVSHGRTFRPVGSVSYLSPEGLEDPAAVDTQSDMWSIGVILYRLLTGKPPFFARTLQELIRITKECKFEKPILPNATQKENNAVAAFLGGLLHPDPNSRFTARTLNMTIFAVLEQKLLEMDPEFIRQFFLAGGDMWTCMNCWKVVHPSGQRCPACGRMEEEWLPWNE